MLNAIADLNSSSSSAVGGVEGAGDDASKDSTPIEI